MSHKFCTTDFMEWLGTTCFSFLEGVSFPDDLVESAYSHGYQGIGIADRMGLYGVIQGLAGFEKCTSNTSNASGESSFMYAPGVRLHFDEADPLFVYPLHKRAYGELCSYLSGKALEGMPLGQKGLNPLPWRDFFHDFLKKFSSSISDDFILISASEIFFPWISDPVNKRNLEKSNNTPAWPQSASPNAFKTKEANIYPFYLMELAEFCGSGPASALSLAYPLTLAPGCETLCEGLQAQSRALGIPLLATTLPLFANKSDQDLCDLATSIRHTIPIKNLGFLKQSNGERRLLSHSELEFFRKKISNHRSDFLWDPFERSLELGRRHRFSLRELKYKYPREAIPQGYSASEWLRTLTFEGAKSRYPDGIPTNVIQQLEHELSLVATLEYEDYFLTLWDVLKYAREKEILFQGRGSAANSAICFCLGITAIDPVRMGLLFERFLSLERREPPDIDVDFEHERREEVMQEVYARYGRNRAAMVATVICFRHRMAVRETAKALGASLETQNALVRHMGRDGMRRLLELESFEGLNATQFRLLKHLAPRLKGLPRHIGLHTGGFVLSHENVTEMCVCEPARMPGRSVIPWDKDDVDYLGWMKVDLLSLGMLTAIRKTFDLIGSRNVTGKKLSLATVPSECPLVYHHLRRADTVGVFQIESRAQMNMLPRLAPRQFYDLVVEVAIVRPGPLQGGMVHPYLRRRQGLDPITFDHPKLKPILAKTLGVPLFQEQVMKVAVAVANFTPGEADQLRKVMSGAWRARSSMATLKEKLLTGMAANGLTQEFAEKVYKQIEGFGEYGFPESHAASFAILTYISSWLKIHHPSEFLCALLNSQPMGFYSPRALIDDAQRHGVKVFPIDVSMTRSWDCALELNPQQPQKPFVRLGYRLIRGFRKSDVSLIQKLQDCGVLSPERDELPSFEELRSLGLEKQCLEKLIFAKALREPIAENISVHDSRRNQLWELKRLRASEHRPLFKLFDAISPKASQVNSTAHLFKAFTHWEALLRDYQSTGVHAIETGEAPWQAHPAGYAREILLKTLGQDFPWLRAEEIFSTQPYSVIYFLGLLSVRQRPPTAGGIVFVTLEDETGFFNLTLMPDVYEQYRLTLEGGLLLAGTGHVEKSFQNDPRDPHTAAYSLKVQSLWNPFIRQNLPPISVSRHWG